MDNNFQSQNSALPRRRWLATVPIVLVIGGIWCWQSRGEGAESSEPPLVSWPGGENVQGEPWIAAIIAAAEGKDTAKLQTECKKRLENQLDLLKSQNESLKLSHSLLASDLSQAESLETRGTNILAVLSAIQNNPEKVSQLQEHMPRAAEISAAYRAIQETKAKLTELLLSHTDNHPDIKLLNSQIKVLEQQFQDVVRRAHETAVVNLDLISRLKASILEKEAGIVQASTNLVAQIHEIENKISQLESGVAPSQRRNPLHEPLIPTIP